jgi:hypothetical protein
MLECGLVASWRPTGSVLLMSTSAPHRTTACWLVVENVTVTAGKGLMVGACAQLSRTLLLPTDGLTITMNMPLMHGAEALRGASSLCRQVSQKDRLAPTFAERLAHQTRIALSIRCTQVMLLGMISLKVTM